MSTTLVVTSLDVTCWTATRTGAFSAGFPAEQALIESARTQ
ncbi:hypothetical protein PCH70_19650 [Pseudomonas cichorii JBC1]|nr:hypothetical protein PCH70_19650 [Pseudomonas cichorii JBC1]